MEEEPKDNKRLNAMERHGNIHDHNFDLINGSLNKKRNKIYHSKGVLIHETTTIQISTVYLLF